MEVEEENITKSSKKYIKNGLRIELDTSYLAL